MNHIIKIGKKEEMLKTKYDLIIFIYPNFFNILILNTYIDTLNLSKYFYFKFSKYIKAFSNKKKN